MRGSREGTSEAANAQVAQVRPTPLSVRSRTRSGRPSTGSHVLARTRAVACSTKATVTAGPHTAARGWVPGAASATSGRAPIHGTAPTVGRPAESTEGFPVRRRGPRVAGVTGEDDTARPARTGAAARVEAMGTELRRLHDRIREVLDDALDAAREGSPDAGPDAARLRSAVGAVTDDSVSRCRAFCAVLAQHDEAEDAHLFPWLLRERPDLAPVVTRLEQDHAMIGTLLAGLAGAWSRGASAAVCAPPRRPRRDHGEPLRYEERELVAVLDGLPPATAGPSLDDGFWQAGIRGERRRWSHGRRRGGGRDPQRGRNRSEARLDGELAGFAAYHLTDELIVFTHTEVDPAFEGKGVGGALARHALDEVRGRGDPQGHAAVPLHQGVDRAAPRLRPARLRGGRRSPRMTEPIRSGRRSPRTHGPSTSPTRRPSALPRVSPRRPPRLTAQARLRGRRSHRSRQDRAVGSSRRSAAGWRRRFAP